MSFPSLTNRGEFFSGHYLDAVIAGDLGDLRRCWDEAEVAHKDTGRSRLRGLGARFFKARAAVTEASRASRPDATRALNAVVLEGLGFTVERRIIEMAHTTSDVLRVPAATTVDTGSGLLLVALDAALAGDVDDLFATGPDAEVELLDPLVKDGERRARRGPVEAVGELFATDEPPRWVMVVAGRVVLLAERSKWAEGRFLAVDLDTALERNDTRRAGELETIAGLFSTDALVPDDGQATIDELAEKSHKHAVGVSKDLREGIRQSIEILANEVVAQRYALTQRRHDTRFSGEHVDPKVLTTQCLRYLYRLLVLLYAESRPELGILPVNDEVYQAGYSVDRLRELALVDLDTDDARGGSHLDESLRRLFALVNDGYHAEHAQTAFAFGVEAIDPDESYEDHLQFPGLDATLFEPASVDLLDRVTLRNEALQKVLRLLLLTPEGKAGGRRARPDRGFISYAQLGINQLGAVYEGLMAYTGFFATEDLYEVAKGGDPSDGTWVVPVDRAGEYPDEVFVVRLDPLTGRPERVRHATDSFVFRLSGRDRQRSASYYTPEVLTRCVVRHALAELLGLDDHAPENGSSGITEARQILDLTICEPALGSGAFLNEAIDQLAEEYLRRRQAEVGTALDPERFRREKQKVKAHFALHQCYGVDLNATAVELAEVSLWLSCMHPGLKAPWFGLQLRRGNSLVGCRRATWRTGQMKARPWAQTTKAKLVPPVDRTLAEPLEGDEVHHFLLPGHGWAAVADRAEARELRPDEAKALKDWRRAVLVAPKPSDAPRLLALAAGVERMWTAATERVRLTQQALRRPIEVWEADPLTTAKPVSRHTAIAALENPDSELGRLRTVMDAWIGLWFWELDADVRAPSWGEWLATLEDLIDPDAAMDADDGEQLDFEDLSALLAADERRAEGRITVAELVEKHPWLGVAVDLARREGAWHWELELAPEFAKGGFDLQVGNPPWTKLFRTDTGFAEDLDPHWGLDGPPPPNCIRTVLRALLVDPDDRNGYFRETAATEATREFLGSSIYRPSTRDLMINLYLTFLDTTLRNAHDRGAVGLLHPETHLLDPKGGTLRRLLYSRLRRHFQMSNHLQMFEDIAAVFYFSVGSYGCDRGSISFTNVSGIVSPETIDASIAHDGSGEVPSLQRREGGWDLRPHTERLVTVDDQVLADWARLFDEPGTPSAEARLLRPVIRADLGSLAALAAQPVRLGHHQYHWTPGWHEKGSRSAGLIKLMTTVPPVWEEAILQGPHVTIANAFAKQPNVACRSKNDYSEWDLEELPERVVPRTNYQRACDRDSYEANLAHWDGRPATDRFRHIHREMTQPGLERSVQGAIVPPGASHIHACLSYGFDESMTLARFAGLMASIPVDYLFKASGATHVAEHQLSRLPLPREHPLDGALVLRGLRLNCLTADYAPLWEELFDLGWAQDSWTVPHATVDLGDGDPTWTMATPLRRDVDRRLALVEIDALAALMLGLSSEQLCAMYRTQFPVLRKYEHAMAFDAEGRKLCKHHQSAGYRQAQLQDHAKAADLPPEWKSLWKLYEQWEDDPDSVDWRGHFHPPFHRPDREAEMTTAYETFQRRLEEASTASADDTSAPSLRLVPSPTADHGAEPDRAEDAEEAEWEEVLAASRLIEPMAQPRAADAAGVTWAQLDDWTQRGWLEPTPEGRHRFYDADEIVRAVWLRSMAQASYDLATLADAVRTNDLAARYLVTHPHGVSAAASPAELDRLTDSLKDDLAFDQLPTRRTLVGPPPAPDGAHGDTRARPAV